MKILIVEDERELSAEMSAYLSDSKYQCESAFDFKTALDKIETFDYACIILDIGLPGGNGLNLLKYLKEDGKADGVIIVSAKDSLDERILGLQTGADDYLTKPFHLAELGARVAAIIRRKSFDGKTLIETGDLVVDLEGRSVIAAGNVVDLTNKEFEMLLYLIGNKNKVISKTAIANHLWGDAMESEENLDFIYTHIKNLRRKLTDAGADDRIKAVYGTGYKFVAQ